MKNKMNHKDLVIAKDNIIMDIFQKWILCYQEGKSIIPFFTENGYKRVAIYGVGRLGNCLLKELENSPIQVVCCIDKFANEVSLRYRVLRSVKELQNVDVIINTVVFEWEDVIAELSQDTDIEIIPIQDIFSDL